jgi:predicted small metal-binding protein
MKTMTCKQLGGACDLEFKAETFEEIAEKSKDHGMEMFQSKDEEHVEAFKKIMELTKDPDEMLKWYEGKKKEFEELPED